MINRNITFLSILMFLSGFFIVLPSQALALEPLSGGGGGGGGSLSSNIEYSGACGCTPIHCVYCEPGEPVSITYFLPTPNLSAVIDNYKNAGPASGVNEADAIYEFPVEGGITRMMAVYKWDTDLPLPTVVGPIRSARPYFNRVASTHRSVYAHAGGSADALDGLANSFYNVYNMEALGYNAESYFYRDTNLNAPHNLFTTIGNLLSFRDRATYDSEETPSWPWNFESSPSTDNMFVQNEILVDYDGDDYDLKWTYDAVNQKYKRYIKTNGNYELSYDANNIQITTENLAIQYSHTDSLQEIVENEGRALVCRQGMCQNAFWRKENIDKPIRFYSFGGEEISLINGRIWINTTQNTFFNDIKLASGWNVVSTPRVVDTHYFSAEETLDNFEIYVLDPESTSGWSTIGQLGQTEFTPLYGYFVNNKTGQDQILTLNYTRDLDPNERLFNRDLTPGWNVFGVASPGIGHAQNKINYLDTDNVSDIMSSMNGKISTLLDFTNISHNRSTVQLTNDWKDVSFYQANELDDFRVTKAYGAYVIESGTLHGTQNLNPIHQHKKLAINVFGPRETEIKELGGRIILGEVIVSARDYDVYLDYLPLILRMEEADYQANLQNISLHEPIKFRNHFAWDYNPNIETNEHKFSFRNIYLEKNKEYHYYIMADVPSTVVNGQTYQLLTDPNEQPNSSYWPSWTKVGLVDVAYNTSVGKILRVSRPITATLSKVTTSNKTVVEGAQGVLLYKGKITANNIDNLTVSKLSFSGVLSGGNFSDDWSKLYLYHLKYDPSIGVYEDLLDTETSLSGDSVVFSEFSFNVPKEVYEGQYIVVRGDVKSAPSGNTSAISWSPDGHVIKDSKENILKSEQYEKIDLSIGQITTVSRKGSYIMEIDTEQAGLNHSRSILAGTIALIGRLKLIASNENAVIEDLVIENYGTAENNTLKKIFLYEDREMTRLIASTDVGIGTNPKALFEDINYEIPLTGINYLYLAGMISPIDYSSSPGIDSTGVAEATVILRVPDNAPGYITKVSGLNTGEVLDFPGATGNTNTVSVLGAVMSNINSDFANRTLVNGIAKDIFSFKVTVPNSNNLDYSGAPLGIRIGEVNFQVAKGGTFDLSNFRVKRIGGVDGSQDAIAQYDPNSGKLSVNFQSFYGEFIDHTIRPGDSAEYILSATVSGLDSYGNSLQVTIENIDNNFKYYHNTTAVGRYTHQIPPQLTGISDVRGGLLSN
jgi:hypothetical protein